MTAALAAASATRGGSADRAVRPKLRRRELVRCGHAVGPTSLTRVGPHGADLVDALAAVHHQRTR